MINELVFRCLEFRNFEFRTIVTASHYEKLVQRKNVLLVALYLARNKGGGAESR